MRRRWSTRRAPPCPAEPNRVSCKAAVGLQRQPGHVPTVAPMNDSRFMFATGVENSNPTVGGRRVAELEKCGHYRHWLEDFGLVSELGIRFLRYGPPLHRTWLGPGRCDWEFADQAFGELRLLDIIP